MIKVFLVSALFAVVSGNLFIGLHYTDTQGGDKELEIGVNMNLNGVSNWNNNLSRYKITGDETWEFYDNADYAGEPLFVKSGPLDWTRVDAVFNDKVSSVKLAGPLVRILSGDNEPLDSGVNSFQLSEGSSVQAVKGDYTCTAN